jgi:hypothetical protein
VHVDYGFMNCKTREQSAALKDVYRQFFQHRDGDPMKLHEAAIQGKLFQFVGSILKLKRSFAKLMKNPYPLPDIWSVPPVVSGLCDLQLTVGIQKASFVGWSQLRLRPPSHHLLSNLLPSASYLYRISTLCLPKKFMKSFTKTRTRKAKKIQTCIMPFRRSTLTHRN